MAPNQPEPARFRVLLSCSMALMAMSIAGCGTDRADADQRTPVERVHEMVVSEPKLATYLENLRAIQAAAASEPELEPLSVKPTEVERTHWIYERYLSGEDSWPPPAGSCVALPELDRVMRLVASKEAPKKVQDWQVEGYGRDIKEITELTHVFVCRQDKAVRGTMSGEHLFEGGFFRGECRAYDPWTKKYLGGFPLKASIPNKALKDNNPKRQQEKLDWQLEHAVGNEAHRLAMGVARPGSSRPSFKCVWANEAKQL